MRGKIIMFVLLVIVVVSIYIIASPVWGYAYYSIGGGPIRDMKIDSTPGRLIIASGQAVYIVNASDGEVIDIYETPGRNIVNIVASSPDNNLLYGIGGCNDGGLQVSINRDTGQISDSAFPSDLHAEAQIQDSDYLYATARDRIADLEDNICVFNKSDLSLEAVWTGVSSPAYAVYDTSTNTILVAQWNPYSHWPPGGDYIPAAAGVQWLCDIGRYDPSRQGMLLEKYTVSGNISGLAIMSDCAPVVGLAGTKENPNVQASTFAVLSDPIEYVDIYPYHVIAMDLDAATDRLICSVRDYEEETGGHILVWDYNSREYEIIEPGMTGLIIIKFLDGKLFTANGQDNKLYVIPIDE